MTSPNESVEMVEVTWKIRNFGEVTRFTPCCGRSCSPILSNVFRREVFIGGRTPTAYPQSKSPPVKLEVTVFKKLQLTPSVSLDDEVKPASTWVLGFSILSEDSSQPISPCTIRGTLMVLETLECENTLVKAMKEGEEMKSIDFSKTEFQFHDVVLFDHSDADSHMEKSDESLNIYFELKITCSLPEPIRGEMTGEFALSGGLESLLIQRHPENTDVEIKVSVEEDEEVEVKSFQCHKLILAVLSPVFRAMFLSDMKETKNNVVEVNDILPTTMEHFLSFLYCGRFQDSSWIQWLPQLAYAADKYDVKALKDLCNSHFIRCVTLRNALTLGAIAEKHGLTDATRDIRNFIAENANGVTLDSDIDVNPSTCDPDFNVTYIIPADFKDPVS